MVALVHWIFFLISERKINSKIYLKGLMIYTIPLSLGCKEEKEKKLKIKIMGLECYSLRLLVFLERQVKTHDVCRN